jgi:hypothetical protein
MSRRRTLFLSLLTLLAALLIAAGGAQATAAPAGLALQPAVGRSTTPTPALIGSQPPRSGTSRLTTHRYDRNTVATGVAAEEGAVAVRGGESAAAACGVTVRSCINAFGRLQVAFLPDGVGG